jgi:hypothetical protein
MSSHSTPTTVEAGPSAEEGGASTPGVPGMVGATLARTVAGATVLSAAERAASGLLGFWGIENSAF